MFKEMSKEALASLASFEAQKAERETIEEQAKAEQVSSDRGVIELFISSLKNEALALEARSIKNLDKALKDADMTLEDVLAERKVMRDLMSKHR